MNEELEWRVALEQLIEHIELGCQAADEEFGGLNEQLSRLAATGILDRAVIFGPVVLSRPYGVGSHVESGQAVQAVLTLPVGFGAVYWDTDDGSMMEDMASRKETALREIIPYEACEPVVRALIAPHVGLMVKKLRDSVVL